MHRRSIELTALVMSCAGGPLAPPILGQAPLPIAEAPGHLTTGDFDDDGCDDVLVLGMYGRSRAFMGRARSPHFVAGRAFTDASYWSLLDAPVHVGGHLYVPLQTTATGIVEVRVYRHQASGWRRRRTITLTPSLGGGSINGLKLVELHRDVDADGRPDVLAAWSETPRQVGHGFWAAYLSPSGGLAPRSIAEVRGQTADAAVVDLHPAHPLRRTERLEYLVTLSAANSNRSGGFGFATVRDGPRRGAGAWTTPGPPLAHPHFVFGESPVAFGEFGILPTVRTPLVHLASGPSILLMPALAPPYVGRVGEVLATTRTSLLLTQAVADYDGDGRDELVVMETLGSHGHRALMHLGDPARNRSYAQVIALRDPQTGQPASVTHGASGDFDGDGDPDLVLSYWLLHPAGTRGYFALFRCDRHRGPGQPALSRVY